MKRQLTAAVTIIAAAFLATICVANPPTTKQETWGMTFAPIPNLMRMHVPYLQSENTGLLVDKVERDAPADKLGLQTGDIILQVQLVQRGESPRGLITSVDQLPQPASSVEILVLRRGQVRQLPQPQLMGPQFVGAVAGGFGNGGFGFAPAGGVSASSFAGANESVSVSRNGNQMSLDMSLPNLTSQPIRLRGTINEIQAQVRRSQLPPEAKQRVLKAIEQNR